MNNAQDSLLPPDGVYRLEHELENPSADRRVKNSPSVLLRQISPGLFYVTTESYTGGYQRRGIAACGDLRRRTLFAALVYEDSPRAQAALRLLVPALVPMERCFDSVTAYWDDEVFARVLRKLVEAKAVDLRQVEEAYGQSADDDDDW